MNQPVVKEDAAENTYLAERQLKSGTAGWKLLATLGVSAVIAGHFAGWNYGIAIGGWGGMLTALLLMALMYLCLCFSMAELAAIIPTAGGGYGFCRRAFGPLGGYLAGIAIAFEYICAAAAIAVFISAYTETLFGVGRWPVYLACYGVFIAIHCYGVGEALRMLVLLAGLATAGLIAFFITALPDIDPAAWFNIDVTPEARGASTFLPQGYYGILLALPFGMATFLAVEAVPLASEEAHNPQKNVPRGLLAAICVLISFSLLLIVCVPGIAGAQKMGQSDAPLVEALSLHLGPDFFLIPAVNIAALIGLSASFFSVIYAYSRQIFSLSRAGYLPKFLSHTNRRQSPYLAIIFPGIAGFALSLSNAADQLVVIVMFCATLSYILMMAAHIRLRLNKPTLHRPYRTPGGVLTSGTALVLAVFALIATILVNQLLWNIVAVALLGLSLLYFVCYSRRRLVSEAPEEQFDD